MKRTVKLFSICLSLVFLVTACQTTQMTATYLNPEANPELKYDNIYVSAIFNMDESRQLLEDEIAHDLRERNISSSVSHEVFPGPGKEFEENRERVYNEIDAGGNDAILTVAVIWEGSNTRFVPSNNTYSPVVINPYYRDYWRYYGNSGSITYKPGYYTQTRNYFIEANLYNVESKELVWSGQTEVYSLADLDNLSANIADLIINELEDADLLSRAEE